MTRQKPKQKKLTKNRQPARLAGKLDHKLFTYAVAAAAAGVGMMVPQVAEAEIVATKTNVLIKTDVGLILFDLNHDGIPDFGLSNFVSGSDRHVPEGGFFDELAIVPAQAGNAIWEIVSHGFTCAAGVPAGKRIGGDRRFQSGILPMAEAGGSITRGDFFYCPWHESYPAYLGLKFLIDGDAHYGWARVTIEPTGTFLEGFAYETVANHAIVAGATSGSVTEELAPATGYVEPAGLGNLALGSLGLASSKKAGR